MDTTRIKTLGEMRREYILKVLAETDWDFKRACAILNVSEEYLKKQVRRASQKPTHRPPK
jgi:transcriptional regulator with PAS, ATPase and Fis domain